MKKILIVLTFIIISFIIFYHTSYAKYTANSIWDYYLSSNKFYFESDYLNTKQKTNIYNYWDGSGISFNIKNGLNNQVYTKDDIKYEVTCTIKNAKCLVNNEEIYKTTLKGNKLSEDILYFDIIGDTDIAKVDVVAKATYPYRKTLKATFELNKTTPEDIISYDIENLDNYSNLNISNYKEEDKCVRIKFSSANIKVLQTKEMKNISTDDNGFINEFDININKKDTLSIRFYNTVSITKNDFTVLECQ